MAANIQIQNDAGQALASSNFGAIDGGSNLQRKFRLQNVGNTAATSVRVYLARLSANDGIDFSSLAEDFSGNPGQFSMAVLNIGTLAPGAYVYFWAKVNVPVGSTPAGNPRQFNITVNYVGT